MNIAMFPAITTHLLRRRCRFPFERLCQEGLHSEHWAMRVAVFAPEPEGKLSAGAGGRICVRFGVFTERRTGDNPGELCFDKK